MGKQHSLCIDYKHHPQFSDKRCYVVNIVWDKGLKLLAWRQPIGICATFLHNQNTVATLLTRSSTE